MDAPVPSPADLAVAKDGTVYIVASNGIRRVRTHGEIDTVVPGDTIANGYGTSIAWTSTATCTSP